MHLAWYAWYAWCAHEFSNSSLHPTPSSHPSLPSLPPHHLTNHPPSPPKTQTIGSNEDDEQSLLDEFDICTEAPTYIFINPFATNTNPLLWEELQAVVVGADDPLEALRVAGVMASESAVCFLTRGQLGALEEEMERMCSSWAFDAAAFYVSDCLARARVVNNRPSGAPR